MNGRITRKIRQVSRWNWRAYLVEIKKWPLRNRLQLAWWVVFGNERKI